MFSRVAAPHYFFSNCPQASAFSTFSPTRNCFLGFGVVVVSSHSKTCEAVTHCSCDVPFSNEESCGASAHTLLAIPVFSLEKYLFKSFAYFLK